MRLGICAAKALVPTALQWPRTLRSIFSDPLTEFQETQVTGRGTEEMKTNDVTGRFSFGEVGLAIDVGRPNATTRLADVQRVTQALAAAGAVFEEDNPVTHLMQDRSRGLIRPDVLNERVMSVVVEAKIPLARLGEALRALRVAAEQVDTVFCVGVISRVAADGRIEASSELERLGVTPLGRAKVNLGLGRPQQIAPGEGGCGP